jgi:hypothetical protein
VSRLHKCCIRPRDTATLTERARPLLGARALHLAPFGRSSARRYRSDGQSFLVLAASSSGSLAMFGGGPPGLVAREQTRLSGLIFIASVA